ncbi:two-component system sensor histidine kinase YesM [Aequitasia blattaphilus]|uniref:Histidine kinase n=1 Tax=Aequitasia blattaphilus TaxID=2949332 RepID=A0ABT1EC04_9FIRM|nr:histidine kinase [Aequitasia blattaphilus]MCP1103370.1 histidine kinase [Aequitasia blattaphilus]MCR8616010.1 histidine kinase [Aequitasia blattaphilus]
MKKKYLFQYLNIGLIIQTIVTIVLFSILFFVENTVVIKVIAISGILEWIIFLFILMRQVWRPLTSLNKAFQAFAEGYIGYDVFEMKSELSEEHGNMMALMKELLDRKELLQLYKKQSEYLALQNQINPHFLYNTLEGIRSEALIGGLPVVGEMAEVLAKFFRYTISNISSFVSVEDEISNVLHYYQIQKFRFGERINLNISFDENEEKDIKECHMPKLILQPIVENAIKHGIEPMMEDGIIGIRFQHISNRLIIVISDNGVGMEQKELDALNDKLGKIQLNDADALNQLQGVAMFNVSNRIKLLYGEEYGIHFYSEPGVGTDVEVSLPFNKKEDK